MGDDDATTASLRVRVQSLLIARAAERRHAAQDVQVAGTTSLNGECKQ